MADRSIDIIIQAQDQATKAIKGVQKQLKGVAKETKSISKNLGDTFKKHQQTIKNFGIAAVGATTALGVMGKQFLDLGTQIELTQKKANVVFGEYIDDINKVADETASAMGLSKNEFIGVAAGIQDLLIPMGFARDEATKLTTETVSLAGALSEWSGGARTAAEVGEILAKAYLGETDSLVGLGVKLSANEIETRILTNAKKGLTGATEEQSKAIAIQQLIFEKSTDAQKAYEEGGGSLARQQAEMTAKIKDARDAIAIALIPAFNELLTNLQPIIENVAQSTSEWFKNKENVDSVVESVKTTIDVLKTIGSVISFLIGFLKSMGEMFGFVAAEVVIFSWKVGEEFEKIKNTIISVWNAVKETTIGVFSSMKETVVGTIEEVIAFATAAIDKLKKAFDTIISVKNKISSAVSSAASSVTSAISGARANGGPVEAGKSFVVGERGPELFTPGVSGSITPSNQMSSSPTININMGGVVVKGEADEQRLAEKIKDALINEARLFNIGIS